MKLGLYADPHFSRSSSIIIGRKGNFTGRLQNLIDSFTWMNDIFNTNKVDKVVCLGDLTDKPVLTSEEITAMSLCNIEDHYLLLGNHCRSDKEGIINSLAIYPNVINTPSYLDDKKEILLLPYTNTPEKISDIIKDLGGSPKLILSHNDIKGYDYGGHTSNSGYEIPDILESCDLLINGHLHSGGWVVKNRIMNLGSLSGMNFSGTSGEWSHSILIIDTDTMSIDLIENPHAYRFVKENFKSVPQVKSYIDNLNELGHYVIQAKVPEEISSSVSKLLSQSDKVEAFRVIIQRTSPVKSTLSTSSEVEEVPNTNIYDKLKLYINNSKLNNKYSLNIINNIIDAISED